MGGYALGLRRRTGSGEKEEDRWKAGRAEAGVPRKAAGAERTWIPGSAAARIPWYGLDLRTGVLNM